MAAGRGALALSIMLSSFALVLSSSGRFQEDAPTPEAIVEQPQTTVMWYGESCMDEGGAYLVDGDIVQLIRSPDSAISPPDPVSGNPTGNDSEADYTEYAHTTDPDFPNGYFSGEYWYEEQEYYVCVRIWNAGTTASATYYWDSAVYHAAGPLPIDMDCSGARTLNPKSLPTPTPTVTPTKTITAKVKDYDCDDTEWHFVINQIDSPGKAPAYITVRWANGAEENVPLDRVTGKTAHYSTTSNLNSAVTLATANIYIEWSGRFNLSHGPCVRSNYVELETDRREVMPGDMITLNYLCDFTNWPYEGVPVDVYLAAIKNPKVIGGPSSIADALAGGSVCLFGPGMKDTYPYRGRVGKPTFRNVMFSSASPVGYVRLKVPRSAAYRGEYVIATAFVRRDTRTFLRTDGRPVENSNLITVR